MELWQTREQALVALQGDLQERAEVIRETFELIDECTGRFKAIDSPFARVCGLTLVKGRNMALGVYSLILDGLGQEAGALLRPLIEILELLVYLRLDPARVDKAIAGKLPSAGQIAKKIEGEFKDLRQHLNEHASHFGFTYDSLRHIVDLSKMTWRTSQPYNEDVLKTNLGTLFLFTIRLAIEGINCATAAQTMLDNELADRIESHRDRVFGVFFEEQGVQSQQSNLS
jgi:hypothetical protein